MKRYALLLVGLLVLAGCDDGAEAAVPLDLPPDAGVVDWTADGAAASLQAPQVNCPDPEVDAMVGTLVENGRTTVYTNPVLGVELTMTVKPCIIEPDYLFDQYGFTLIDSNTGGNILSVDWLYQSEPEQLESVVRQTIDSYPELDVQQERITVDGHEGVMLWPLPGTETTAHIYLTANGRLYQLIFWSAPPDDQTQALLDGLRFIEPTQSLDSLNLPPAR